MKKYKKLVRDRIPEILDEKGIPYNMHIATHEEYKKELVKKLKEETKEFLETPTNEELADMLEVIRALKKLPEYKNVEMVRKEKCAKRGGFKKRFIVQGEK